jgi:hypothetical protein
MPADWCWHQGIRSSAVRVASVDRVESRGVGKCGSSDVEDIRRAAWPASLPQETAALGFGAAVARALERILQELGER